MTKFLLPLKSLAALAALAVVLSGCVVHNHGRGSYRSDYGYVYSRPYYAPPPPHLHRHDYGRHDHGRPHGGWRR